MKTHAHSHQGNVSSEHSVNYFMASSSHGKLCLRVLGLHDIRPPTCVRAIGPRGTTAGPAVDGLKSFESEDLTSGLGTWKRPEAFGRHDIKI